MSISEIELRFLVSTIKTFIDDVYYVSSVYPITNNSFIIKFHHSQKNDVSLLISTHGLCITKYKYSTVEDNEAIKKIKSNLERSRLVEISTYSGERIAQFVFQNSVNNKYYLIIEMFGNGNIILCDEKSKILAITNSLSVRHRILKTGLNYFPPPSRGIDITSLNFDNFLSFYKSHDKENINIKRWLGRTFSISKKFIEYVVNNSKIGHKNINELTNEELTELYDGLISLITNVSSGKDLQSCIILDEDSNPADISPFIPYNINSKYVKSFNTYFDAIDEFLNYLITHSDAFKNSDLEKKIEILEHDLHEQEKAKNFVILKSTKLRDFASLIMQQTVAIMDIHNDDLKKILVDYDGKIINSKGKYFLEMVDEKILLEGSTINIPKLSSSLFNLAKDMERGLVTIENSQLNIQQQIDKLKQQKNKKPLAGVRVLSNKEWYEKYRWFFTSDNLLAIGGKDASSNSVIIRRYLTENDYVFHAEVNGSPFFILQNANNSTIDITQSILEVSQATVSFSRSWKDALSSSDAYWVFSSQLKKGAPTGQFLPKGSFVIEGKRNFVKNLEIKLAIGVSIMASKLLLIVGPYETVKKRSICVRTLLPSGLDVVKASKKIKSDFVDYSIKNNFSKNTIEYLKGLPIDDLVRILPVGQCKLLPVEKGDLKDIFDIAIEK